MKVETRKYDMKKNINIEVFDVLLLVRLENFETERDASILFDATVVCIQHIKYVDTFSLTTKSGKMRMGLLILTALG